MKLITGKDVLGEDDNYKVPMEVLMEVMEIRCVMLCWMRDREKLSDAKTDEEKDALKGKVKDSFKQHENAFRCGLCKSGKMNGTVRNRGQRFHLQRGRRDEVLRQHHPRAERRIGLTNTCLLNTRIT